MPLNELDSNPDQLYEKLTTHKISQRQKTFIIKALKEQGYKVRKNQKKWVKRNRGKSPLKPSDLPRFFENISSLKMMMASLVSILTGSRRTETIEIKKKNINFDECRILLEITKKGVPQNVYFPRSFAPLLKRWCHYTRDSPYLLPNRLYKDKPMSAACLNQEMVRALKKTSLDEIIYVKENGHKAQKYNFHSFRKFFCSMLINNGVSPATAQILMRHEKMELTLRVYTQLGRRTLTDAMSKIDPLYTSPESIRVSDAKDAKEVTTMFANQAMQLFNRMMSGELSKEDYDKHKKELIELQKSLGV